MAQLMLVSDAKQKQQTVVELDQPTAFDKAGKMFTSKLHEVQREFAKRKFESKLKNIIVLANSHRMKNVPKGDAAYKDLYAQAVEQITVFTTLYGGNAESAILNAPALRELEQWATFDADAVLVNNFRKYAAIALGGCFATGALAGVVAVGYHVVTFWMK